MARILSLTGCLVIVRQYQYVCIPSDLCDEKSGMLRACLNVASVSACLLGMWLLVTESVSWFLATRMKSRWLLGLQSRCQVYILGVGIWLSQNLNSRLHRPCCNAYVSLRKIKAIPRLWHLKPAVSRSQRHQQWVWSPALCPWQEQSSSAMVISLELKPSRMGFTAASLLSSLISFPRIVVTECIPETHTELHRWTDGRWEVCLSPLPAAWIISVWCVTLL